MEARVLWRFSDGKPGHDNQTLGLVEALAKLLPVEIYTLTPLPWCQALGCFLRRRFPTATGLKNPDLILGAGHRTHLSLLAARRARGGRSVVLMRPSLPLGWFDLCLIPEHDNPPQRPNVLPTRGVLNRIQPAPRHDPTQGLLLIGGPSPHFHWDNGALWQQIGAVVKATPQCRWILTTSRRTPVDFLDDTSISTVSNCTVVPYSDTGPDWLPRQLSGAGQVWVTADSVSMVYEALTAGAAVGILEIPSQHENRVNRGLEGLRAEGMVTFYRDWWCQPLFRSAADFDEAARCADWIYRQWLTNNVL